MSERKWTKGPWSFDPINTELVIQESSDPYTYIAEIWEGEPALDGVSTEERAANARLIAAAPDLYEALEAVLPYAANYLDDMDSNIVKARAALQRAEGEGT